MRGNAIIAVMTNELKIISREPGGLILLIILPYFIAGGMAFIASFFTRVTGGVFIRQFIGFEVLMLSMIMLMTGSRFLYEERNGGRLEPLMATPTSMYLVLFATSFVMVLVDMGAFTIASVPLVYAEYGLRGLGNMVIGLLLLFLGLMPLYGLGLLLAGLILRFNDADSIMNVVTPILTILSGATYPIYVLPQWIRLLILALPMYPTADLIYSVVSSHGLNSLFLNLVLSVIAYLLIGVVSYGELERTFRRRGL
ncbi:ABC transporter permease [Vulcanisaeta thermophila]|uniref:ABC transporter permease n=1 Tax=Vulcanisaeta thermophila TaxID=867917 RepID=UPI000853D1A1|nr:ABC transporter permease [Vulcanisaeta thermophila]